MIGDFGFLNWKRPKKEGDTRFEDARVESWSGEGEIDDLSSSRIGGTMPGQVDE